MILKRTLCVFALTSLVLTGCSSSGTASSTSSANLDRSSAVGSADVKAAASANPSSQSQNMAGSTKSSSSTSSLLSIQSATQTQKMVIYNADMTIEVKNFSTVQSQIEQLASTSGGYTLDSTVSDADQTKRSGTITLRIPNQGFESFLAEVSKLSSKIVSRTVTGQDVTDQYVDLQSSLKAKQQVADRLTIFMQNAKTTEDLLKVSNELAQVQQDIETIKGRMKYLEVNSALSKVTIKMSETQAVVASLKLESPGVWGKTKVFFVNNLNWLVGILSALFIFIFGASPTLLIVAAIVWLVLFIRNRQRRRSQEIQSHVVEASSKDEKEPNNK